MPTPPRTEWFDELNPLHDFADAAVRQLADGIHDAQPDRARFNRMVDGLPFVFEKNTHTGPQDQPSRDRYVLVTLDSVASDEPGDFVSR